MLHSLRLREQRESRRAGKDPVVQASDELVKRFELANLLEGHTGCVNTISFNEGGSLLVSGSDDRRLMLWDVEQHKLLHQVQTIHQGNIFGARFLFETNDEEVVSCAADGLVCHSHMLRAHCSDQPLAVHDGAAYKVCVHKAVPKVVLSCGEDGKVRRTDISDSVVRTFDLRLLPRGGGGGGRGERGLVHAWQPSPLQHALLQAAQSPHQGRKGFTVTCLRYDRRGSSLLVTYSGDFIYQASPSPLTPLPPCPSQPPLTPIISRAHVRA